MSHIYFNEETGTWVGQKIIEEAVLMICNEPEIRTTVKKVTRQMGLQLIVGDSTHDLLTIGAFCTVLDPEIIESWYWDIFSDMHSLENPNEMAIVLTKPMKLKPGMRKFFVDGYSNGNLEVILRTTMFNRRRNILSRKTDKKHYTKKLNRLFVMLRYLEKEGNYINVNNWAKEFGVSEKTIKRDLTYLREVGGEEIKYSPEHKAYYLDNSYFSYVETRFNADFHAK